MNPADLVALAGACGVTLFLDERGEVVYEADRELPAIVLETLRQHRDTLVSHLSAPDLPVEPELSPSESSVRNVPNAFEGKIVAMVSPRQPLPFGLSQDFLDSFPPERRLSHLPPDCWPWLDVAVGVMARDYDANPIDKAELDSLFIGLKATAAQGSSLCAHAVEHLQKVKATKWGKKDATAGCLLPRRPTGKQPAPQERHGFCMRD